VLVDNTPDRNVFILGAGFSVDAGAPLVNDFLDTARELFDDPNSNLDEQEKEDFKKVFEFRKHVSQAREKFKIDLDNIEQLFGLIEMSYRLDSGTSNVRDAMVYVIAKTLQLAIQGKGNRPSIVIRSSVPNAPWMHLFNPGEQLHPNVFRPDIYRHFANLITGKYDDPAKLRSRANIVITFNYDLVLDNVLRRLDVNPDYGLDEPAIEGSQEKGVQISLLKLHGSTNWAICPSCQKVHVLQDVKFTDDPGAFRMRSCSRCGGAGLRLLLVPPTWDKSEYREAMRPVWKKAIDALKSAKRICIIGYSMPETDTFFKFLLTLGLADNYQLFRLVVVDLVTPGINRSTIEQRYREMLEGVFESRRFKFFGDGFANFLNQGASSAIGRAEMVMTSGII
jgi:NAD-dependent SIR2 family protein deacetylase